jgi:hypothetical protein
MCEYLVIIYVHSYEEAICHTEYDFAPAPFKISIPFLPVQRLSRRFFFSLFLASVWLNEGFTLFCTLFRNLHKKEVFFHVPVHTQLSDCTGEKRHANDLALIGVLSGLAGREERAGKITTVLEAQNGL